MNGTGHLVVMSMEVCDKQCNLLDIHKKLGAAEKQLEDGVRLLDGKDVFQRLRAKHGK